MNNCVKITEETPFAEALGILNISFPELIELVRSKSDTTSPQVSQNKVLLTDAVKNYLTLLKKQVDNNEKSPHTHSAYQEILESFLEFVKTSEDRSLMVNDVSKTMIIEFLSKPCKNGQANSASYRNKKLWTLSAFFKCYLTETLDLLPVSPTKGIKHSHVGDLPIRFLTKEEQLKVLISAIRNKQTGPRDYFFIILALYTGLRLEELVSLNIRDIDLSSKYLYVLRGKGRKARSVPLSTEARQNITRYLKDVRKCAFDTKSDAPLFLSYKGPKAAGRLSKGAATKMVTRVFRANGIAEGALHRLRHTFAVMALESGMTLPEIKTILGHADLTTTIRYLRLDNRDILKKVEKHYPLAFVSVSNILEYVNRLNTPDDRALRRIGNYES